MLIRLFKAVKHTKNCSLCLLSDFLSLILALKDFYKWKICNIELLTMILCNLRFYYTVHVYLSASVLLFFAFISEPPLSEELQSTSTVSSPTQTGPVMYMPSAAGDSVPVSPSSPQAPDLSNVRIAIGKLLSSVLCKCPWIAKERCNPPVQRV